MALELVPNTRTCSPIWEHSSVCGRLMFIASACLPHSTPPALLLPNQNRDVVRRRQYRRTDREGGPSRCQEMPM